MSIWKQRFPNNTKTSGHVIEATLNPFENGHLNEMIQAIKKLELKIRQEEESLKQKANDEKMKRQRLLVQAYIQARFGGSSSFLNDFYSNIY
jgi:hypothetical protein